LQWLVVNIEAVEAAGAADEEAGVVAANLIPLILRSANHVSRPRHYENMLY
jgi:hypothetical protein